MVTKLLEGDVNNYRWGKRYLQEIHSQIPQIQKTMDKQIYGFGLLKPLKVMGVVLGLLAQGFLKPCPAPRMPFKDIKSHFWFSSENWNYFFFKLCLSKAF